MYTEWVMKRNNDSLYGQNMQLYAWGILFNGIGLTISDSRKDFQVGFECPHSVSKDKASILCTATLCM